MNTGKQLTWIGLVLAVASAGATTAQENERATERLELTMTLLPEQARDAAEITRRIELPPAPAPAATEGAKPDEPPGQENGQGQGRDTAAEARERGREFGQDVAAEARDNRENAGRGADPPGPPETPPGQQPDRPTPPDNPNRP